MVNPLTGGGEGLLEGADVGLAAAETVLVGWGEGAFGAPEDELPPPHAAMNSAKMNADAARIMPIVYPLGRSTRCACRWRPCVIKMAGRSRFCAGPNGSEHVNSAGSAFHRV